MILLCGFHAFFLSGNDFYERKLQYVKCPSGYKQYSAIFFNGSGDALSKRGVPEPLSNPVSQWYWFISPDLVKEESHWPLKCFFDRGFWGHQPISSSDCLQIGYAAPCLNCLDQTGYSWLVFNINLSMKCFHLYHSCFVRLGSLSVVGSCPLSIKCHSFPFQAIMVVRNTSN